MRDASCTPALRSGSVNVKKRLSCGSLASGTWKHAAVDHRSRLESVRREVRHCESKQESALCGTQPHHVCEAEVCRKGNAAAVATKRVRFAGVAADNTDSPTGGTRGVIVTLFNRNNPANAHGLDEIDHADLERQENERVVLQRLRHRGCTFPPPTAAAGASSGASPSPAAGHPPPVGGPAGGMQQAFSIFAIPVLVDSQALTVPELRAELRARGLRTDGTKLYLVRRLDKFIKANEKERIAQAPQAA